MRTVIIKSQVTAINIKIQNTDKSDNAHTTKIFYFIIVQPTLEPEIIIVCLSM